jgi:competence protein ComFC
MENFYSIKNGLHKSPALLAYHYFWQLLDWIYPPSCSGCGAVGVRWCDDCMRETEIIEGSTCPVCGMPHSTGNTCEACQENPRHFISLQSWAIYGGKLRDAIHKMKYNKDIGIAEHFSGFLIHKLEDLMWEINLIVAVPLSKKRYRERGYNQAALLAKPVSWSTGIPFSPKALERIRETTSQVKLSADERKINVAGAFSGNSFQVMNKKILIIDDLATTCSTIDACASALLDAGAERVYALTLARAI